ncbi:MAG: F0F1 ATP synthase subunit gamma [Deltaproteobacteria bacterium]|nr:F0F1 ATP synthase subunit gamma [Deltaproteobacteria bacterium]
MKMVSAAKLKKAQDEIVAARPYAEKMLELVGSLASKASSTATSLNRVKKITLALFTSDRGLAEASTRSSSGQRKGSSAARLVRRKPLSRRQARGEISKRRNITVLNARPVGSNKAGLQHRSRDNRDLVGSYLKGRDRRGPLIFSEFKSASRRSRLR